MTDPVVRLTFDTVSIFFDDVLHVRFTRSDFRFLQSYSTGEGNFIIEFSVRGINRPVRCEYDSADKWLAILKQLEGVL